MITVEVEITLDSPRESQVIYYALQPEISSPISKGITMEQRENRLGLKFQSRDTASMRASVNSVLRWVRTSRSLCNIVRRD
jgi:KEOPS complex subunit Pcc1